MHKKRIWIVGVVVFCVVVATIAATLLIREKINEEYVYRYDERVKYLNEEVDLTLYTYGEEIGFWDNVEYQDLDILDVESISLESDYVYLIINDRNGSVGLTQEDVFTLQKFAQENLNFNFYYIGTEALGMFRRAYPNVGYVDGGKSFFYNTAYGKRLPGGGIWREDDDEFVTETNHYFDDALIMFLEQDIRSCEK